MPAPKFTPPEIRMVRLLRAVYMGGGCACLMSRPFKGETCREYATLIQGVPSSGCTWCEIEELLKEIGQLPKRR